MTRITRSENDVVARVQSIVREHVPGANCKLIDYDKRVGCGELDAHPTNAPTTSATAATLQVEWIRL